MMTNLRLMHNISKIFFLPLKSVYYPILIIFIVRIHNLLIPPPLNMVLEMYITDENAIDIMPHGFSINIL